MVNIPPIYFWWWLGDGLWNWFNHMSGYWRWFRTSWTCPISLPTSARLPASTAGSPPSSVASENHLEIEVRIRMENSSKSTIFHGHLWWFISWFISPTHSPTNEISWNSWFISPTNGLFHGLFQPWFIWNFDGLIIFFWFQPLTRHSNRWTVNPPK